MLILISHAALAEDVVSERVDEAVASALAEANAPFILAAGGADGHKRAEIATRKLDGAPSIVKIATAGDLEAEVARAMERVGVDCAVSVMPNDNGVTWSVERHGACWEAAEVVEIPPTPAAPRAEDAAWRYSQERLTLGTATDFGTTPPITYLAVKAGNGDVVSKRAFDDLVGHTTLAQDMREVYEETQSQINRTVTWVGLGVGGVGLGMAGIGAATQNETLTIVGVLGAISGLGTAGLNVVRADKVMVAPNPYHYGYSESGLVVLIEDHNHQLATELGLPEAEADAIDAGRVVEEQEEDEPPAAREPRPEVAGEPEEELDAEQFEEALEAE